MAAKKFRKSKLRRILNGWRNFKYENQVEKYCHTYTAKCSIETRELERIQKNLTERLHEQLLNFF